MRDLSINELEKDTGYEICPHGKDCVPSGACENCEVMRQHMNDIFGKSEIKQLRDRLQKAEAQLQEWKDIANTEQTKWADACFELAELQDELQQAEADNAALAVAINDVYPMVAGRTMDLMSAGEEKAAEHWNKASQKLYMATQHQNPGAALLKELKGLRKFKKAMKTIEETDCKECAYNKEPDCPIRCSLGKVHKALADLEKEE